MLGSCCWVRSGCWFKNVSAPPFLLLWAKRKEVKRQATLTVTNDSYCQVTWTAGSSLYTGMSKASVPLLAWNMGVQARRKHSFSFQPFLPPRPHSDFSSPAQLNGRPAVEKAANSKPSKHITCGCSSTFILTGANSSNTFVLDRITLMWRWTRGTFGLYMHCSISEEALFSCRKTITAALFSSEPRVCIPKQHFLKLLGKLWRGLFSLQTVIQMEKIQKVYVLHDRWAACHTVNTWNVRVTVNAFPNITGPVFPHRI